MKLFGILFAAGTAALLGVTATTTCPAEDVFSEMMNEKNPELHDGEAGFCPADTPSATAAATAATAIHLGSAYVPVEPVCYPFQWGVVELEEEACDDGTDTTSTASAVPQDSPAQSVCDSYEWEMAERQDEEAGFCPMDTPAATPTAAATTAIDLGSPYDLQVVQPASVHCQWGVAGLRDEEAGFCPVDTPTATAAATTTTITTPYVLVQLASNPLQWGVGELRDDDAGFCLTDTPCATAAAATAATATAAAIDLDPPHNLPVAQPVCAYFQWVVAELRKEACDGTTDDALDVSADAFTAATIQQGSPSRPAQDMCPIFQWGVAVAEVDKCSSVDGTERNDGGEILGTSGQDLRSIETNDLNVSGHDAPTAGGEEELQDDEAGSCSVDTTATTAAPAALIADVGEGSRDSLVQRFCYPYQRGMTTTELQDAEDGYCPVDDKTAVPTAAATATTATDLGSGDARSEAVCCAYRWGMTTHDEQNVDVCDVSDVKVNEDDGGAVSAPSINENENGTTSDAAADVAGSDFSTGGTEGQNTDPPSNDEIDSGLSPIPAHDVAETPVESAAQLSDGDDDGVPGNPESADTIDDTDGECPTMPTEGVDGMSTDSALDASPFGLESVLRLYKRYSKDKSCRVVLSAGPPGVELPSLEIFEPRSNDLITGSSTKTAVQLTDDVQVLAVSLTAFHVSKGKASWTLTARDRDERDVWVNGLVHAINGAATFDGDDMLFGGGSAASPPSDVLEVQTRLGMQARTVTLKDSMLTSCKLAKGGIKTEKCEQMTMMPVSGVVDIIGNKGSKDSTRSLFRVMAFDFPKADAWTINAGSPDAKAAWMSLIQGTIDEAKKKYGRDHGPEEFNMSSPPTSMYPPSKGWSLGPNDPPLVIGDYLSNSCPDKPTTLEITEVGDILFSPGLYPDREQEPLWAHRVTATFAGRANGGVFCALEEFWLEHTSRGEIPVTLSVKNGRWRVGRGNLCTLGRSPAPKGSLRRFLPWDERGREVREGVLFLLEDDSVVIASGQTILWDTLTA